MIRIDSIWLATEPMDMRAGTETALNGNPFSYASRDALTHIVVPSVTSKQTSVTRETGAH